MTKKLSIEGMTCGHCVMHVKEALEELEGVKSAKVELDTKLAIVEGDASDVALKEAVEEVGYDVVGIENL